MRTPLFRTAGGGRFEIGQEALTRMLKFVQEEPEQPESGGVLLGRFILGSPDVVVDEVTEPLPGDRQSRFRFFRAAWRHQKSINRAWRESDGTCAYLGEWHTHPEEIPSPSPHDWRNWRRKLARDIYDSDSLFFVIVGTGVLRAWEGAMDGVSFSALGEWTIVRG